MVAAGTPVKVMKDTLDYSPNVVDWETQKDNMFFLEDIVMDPLNPGRAEGEARQLWAATGWYGFNRSGYICMAPMDSVDIH